MGASRDTGRVGGRGGHLEEWQVLFPLQYFICVYVCMCVCVCVCIYIYIYIYIYIVFKCNLGCLCISLL
jgi:hypothetical protein